MKTTNDKEIILKRYNETDQAGKILLESIFGDNYFIQINSGNIKDYTDIKVLPDALEGLGFERTAEIPVVKLLEEHIPMMSENSILNKGDIVSMQALAELIVFNRAINKDYETGEEWEPDWDNANQQKHYPWFKMGSGFGFSAAGYVYWWTHSYAGSRLASKDEERAKYMGTILTETYRKFLTITK